MSAKPLCVATQCRLEFPAGLAVAMEVGIARPMMLLLFGFSVRLILVSGHTLGEQRGSVSFSIVYPVK